MRKSLSPPHPPSVGRWLWGALGERRGAGPELKESRLAPCAPCLSGSPSCPLPCWYRLVAETTLSFPPSPNSLLRLNSSLLELALFCGASHSRSAPPFPFGGPLAVFRARSPYSLGFRGCPQAVLGLAGRERAQTPPCRWRAGLTLADEVTKRQSGLPGPAPRSAGTCLR